MKWRWRWLWFWTFFAWAAAGWLMASHWTDPPWWVLVLFVLDVVSGTVCLIQGIYLRRSYAHRKAERDRGNPGPGSSARHGPGGRTPLAGGSYAYATGANPGSAPGLSLPTRQAETPITAWKAAQLGYDDGRYRFLAMNSSNYYDQEAVAECLQIGPTLGPTLAVPEPSIEHHPPVLECGCGFYALSFTGLLEQGHYELVNIDDPIEVTFRSTQGTVWLEVELYGRVIVCEYGYRAEKQRVMAARAWDPLYVPVLRLMGIELDDRPLCRPKEDS